MIAFALYLFVCTSASDCDWRQVTFYVDELECRQNGLAAIAWDDQVRRYKCTLTVNEETMHK